MTFVDRLVAQLAAAIQERIGSAEFAAPLLNGHAKSVLRNGHGPGVRRHRRRKLDMRCRVANCTNRSKGPRFHFLCEKHVHLPRTVQRAVVKEWNEKHAHAA